jgi:tRNA (guanine37-N1)-methyltransferase
MLSLALVHHPVVNRHGAVVTAAVTNLDLHDIARAARTYGVGPYYVVTPLEDQGELVRRIVAHWIDGAGGTHNPARQEALSLIRQAARIQDARDDFAARAGKAPLVVATGARARPGAWACRRLREHLQTGTPVLLLLGTAWGLAEEVFRQADAVLAPIRGPGPYNHLSVRSAAAILLDRLAAHHDEACETNTTCDRG